MTISTIIPAYRPANIKECILAIANSEHKPLEIILVDDNSGTDYFKDIEQYSRIIKLEKRSGPARARNIGAKASSGDLLCFIDSDVIVFKNTLGLIKSTFEKFLEISAVQTMCTDSCKFTNFVSQYQNLYFYFNINAVREKYLATIIGHCFAVRKNDFDLAGGFDESIKNASVEDGNFGLNLYSRKKRIYLDKNIKIEHKSYVGAGKVIEKMFTKSSDKVYTLLRDKNLFKINPNKTEHSKRKIIAILISPFLLLGLTVPVFWPQLLLTFLLILVVYLLCSGPFIYFCFRKKGIIFAVKVVIFYYINCLLGFCGIAQGLFRFFKYETRKLCNIPGKF